MKIVVLDGYAENPGDLSWSALESLGNCAVYDRTPPERVVEHIGDAEAVYTNKTPITAETLNACPSVRFIGVLATGYNIVDVEAARKRGVVVSNVPSYGTASVAQFTFALLLEACHHIGHHSRAVKEGRWSACPDYCFWDFPLIELAGKTLGIIGLGRIGRAVARIARALDMRVISYNATPPRGEEPLAERVPLSNLLAQSDVISLHCPLTRDNEGMIDRQRITGMKDGVIVVNTARGPLVDEAAMAEALAAGKVACYACDVVSREPILPDNPLLRAPNAIITPHIAWAPKESRQRLMDTAVENLAAFLRGIPQNVVNP